VEEETVSEDSEFDIKVEMLDDLDFIIDVVIVTAVIVLDFEFSNDSERLMSEEKLAEVDGFGLNDTLL
jgi:hypothetical protein